MVAAKQKEIDDINAEKKEWEDMITCASFACVNRSGQPRDMKPRCYVGREEVGEMEAQIEKLTADGAAASEGKTAAEAALALVKEEKAEADDYLAEFEAMSI